jgi:hypothetical protein
MNLTAFCASLAPKHFRNLARLYRNHQWDRDDEGQILIGHARIHGVQSVSTDGETWRQRPNLWTTEGCNYLLSVGVAGGAQYTTFYLAPFSGNVTVADTWTAANFASTATELTTQYSEGTRVAFVESAPASKATSNNASPATFTAATTAVTIWGAGLLSTSTKGATSGVLLTAAKYATAEVLNAVGNTLAIKYELTLSNS